MWSPLMVPLSILKKETCGPPYGPPFDFEKNACGPPLWCPLLIFKKEMHVVPPYGVTFYKKKTCGPPLWFHF